MKIFVGFVAILIAAMAVSADHCYKNMHNACGIAGTTPYEPGECNAVYGGIKEMAPGLQAFVNTNIMTSFDYLLMSTHFGSYATNREGFKGLYRKLSDKTWNDAIDLIKFITQRGAEMNFAQPTIDETEAAETNSSSYSSNLDEIKSLARALDMHKELAKTALNLHTDAQTKVSLDGSVAHYIEEKFMEEHAETVRKLAGYANDMKSFVSKYDAFTVFMFDEYLKSTL